MQDKKLFILLLTIIITAIPAFAKYYCESDEIRGEYTPNSIESCQFWKDMDSEGMYKNCVYANKLGEKAFKSGKCELIIERKYTKDNKICIDQVTQKTNRVIGTACVGK